ncbi:MAG: hypothetical protein HRT77_05095 [Halioglobus sp.]|nr:hypothetical protein [Halioglobus sp.]
MRKTDSSGRKWFRCARFFQEDGDWYFYTREGTIEGPFEVREQAEARLEQYVKVMRSGLLDTDSSLAIEPPLSQV